MPDAVFGRAEERRFGGRRFTAIAIAMGQRIWFPRRIGQPPKSIRISLGCLMDPTEACTFVNSPQKLDFAIVYAT